MVENSSAHAAVMVPSITTTPFGVTPEGEAALYTLRNAHGAELCVTNYGGIIQALRMPDRAGHFDDVVLGYDSLQSYLESSPYFGALIGRYCNRIAHAQFTLDDRTYTLARNNGAHHLHGGDRGFDKVLWQARVLQTDEAAGLLLRYTSPHGEEGYPGTLSCEVTYALTNDNAVVIGYRATTDAPTVVNLTQHSYFNLAGHGAQDCLGHELMIDADAYLPADEGLIPTGEIRPVAGGPFDFRQPTTIGARINDGDEQLQIGHGYDHTFVLNKHDDGNSVAARVYEPNSGRVLEVLTTEPGLQLYTGNFLNGTLKGKHDVAYGWRYGFALETQHFPDSPNQHIFPSTVLRPGQQFRSTTIYKFSVQ